MLIYRMGSSKMNMSFTNTREHRISELKQLLKHHLNERSRAVNKLKEIYGPEIDENDLSRIYDMHSGLQTMFRKMSNHNAKRIYLCL
jgi:hypothetical protein